MRFPSDHTSVFTELIGFLGFPDFICHLLLSLKSKIKLLQQTVLEILTLQLKD